MNPMTTVAVPRVTVPLVTALPTAGRRPLPALVMKLAVTLAMALGVIGGAEAAQPEISRVFPPGVQRGESSQVELVGARLRDATGILFDRPGIRCTALEVVDDQRVVATVEVDDDVPDQLHPFRVLTASGLSNLRLLGVGPLPHVLEQEPNSDFDSPQPVPMNCSVCGVIENEDVDYFEVQLEAGQWLVVEIEGTRHAYLNNFFDPYVAILDSQRFELAASDDSPLLHQDGLCAYRAETAGRYVVMVRESSFGGSPNSIYRLHIGDFPRPIGILPSGGAPGSRLECEAIDVTGESFPFQVELPERAANDWGLWAARDSQLPPSPNRIRVRDLPNHMEAEPNDRFQELTEPLTPPVAINGRLDRPGDVDWFMLEAKAGEQWEITSFARRTLRSPADTWMAIHDSNGKYLAGNDDAGGPDAAISFKVPEDGRYFLRIRDHLDRGGPSFVYRIEIDAPRPRPVLTIAQQQRYVSQTLVIPRGARMAVLANVDRQGIGGPGQLQLAGLPPELKLYEAASLAAGQNNFPLLVEAAAEAPVGAWLVEPQLLLQPSENQSVAASFHERTQLIRGRNNVDVWGYDADRWGVAVTEPAPFDIRCIEPQIPLVRNGQMSLVVEAVRQEGFDRPIAIRLLSTPGGVSASGSVVIAGDQVRAEIPLTANANAAIGRWPLTVLASADVGHGQVTLASPMLELEVADAMFDFRFPKTSAEQGSQALVVVELEAKRFLDGPVEIELVGLPPGSSCDLTRQVWDPEQDHLTFTLDIAADARPGSHKTLACHARLTLEGGIVVQTQGTGEVQIDPPPPAPAEPTPAAPQPETPPAAEPPPPQRPLPRLDQLRQQRISQAAPSTANP